MKIIQSLMRTDNGIVQFIARVALGMVMFPHGAQKAMGVFGGQGFAATMKTFTHGLHIAPWLAFLAIMAEFVGSVGLVTGFLARIAAAGIAVTMGVAIFKVHLKYGFFMNWQGNQRGEGYEYHILAIALALVVLFRGAGKWSIDGSLAGKSKGSGEKKPKPSK